MRMRKRPDESSRAINLAHDKHCGGVQMLRKIAPVADEIAIVNTK